LHMVGSRWGRQKRRNGNRKTNHGGADVWFARFPLPTTQPVPSSPAAALRDMERCVATLDRMGIFHVLTQYARWIAEKTQMRRG